MNVGLHVGLCIELCDCSMTVFMSEFVPRFWINFKHFMLY